MPTKAGSGRRCEGSSPNCVKRSGSSANCCNKTKKRQAQVDQRAIVPAKIFVSDQPFSTLGATNHGEYADKLSQSLQYTCVYGNMKKTILAATLFALLATNSYADLASDLGRLAGYTIIHSGTITGYQDRGKKRQDSYEGCDYGRVIIIDDSYTVTCATYAYSYAYRPTVTILSRNGSLKMVVANDILDVSK